MPLSKVERQVLEVICEEHRQTHRGAKAMIVHVGMNAQNSEQKARIVDVLHALQKRGLLVAGTDTWLPTLTGKAALSEVSSETKQGESPNRCDECGAVLCFMDAKQYGKICNKCFKDLEEAPIPVSSGALPEFNGTVERIGVPLPDDLLNRCAAMTATLLAQAEQAYAGGELEAWRDLHWLMETGKQLVAAGGEA